MNVFTRRIVAFLVLILVSCTSEETPGPVIPLDPTTPTEPAPTDPVVTPHTWKSIAAGEFHSLGVKEDGTLWAWGLNDAGQLGDGTDVERKTPVQIGTATNWVFVACGETSSFAIRNTGSLYAWGHNDDAQLGLGNVTGRSVPTRVGTDTNWQTVSAGRDHTLALKTDGSLWAWGNNGSGQLGLNISTFSTKVTPQRVGTANDWSSIAAGYLHSLAVKYSGTLWSWGSDSYHQLGNGIQQGDFNVPTQVGTNNNWKIVSAGEQHSLAVKTNGTLWGWGANDEQQLGDGTIHPRIAPYQIGTSIDWVDVTAGYEHSLGIKTDHSLWAWGDSTYGRLGLSIPGAGNGDFPTKVSNDVNWNLTAAGRWHTLALKNDKGLWVCGNNESGQLGDGTNTNRTVFKNIQ